MQDLSPTGGSTMIAARRIAPRLSAGHRRAATSIWSLLASVRGASARGRRQRLILPDLAVGKENRWLEMFDATRIKPAAGPKSAEEATGAPASSAGGHIEPKPKSFDAVGRGEAAILKIDGESVAAFRDKQGIVHALSAVCSHMGCIVGWNETDRTWDCPCHGSRFELSGQVLAGPATKPLTSKIGG
jgi:nitrite reductase/ring-hydroxylating ferredoxin subunit